jgi:PAS domain-containing protein
MRQIVAQKNLPAGALERRIATSLPYLFEAGRRVIFYAREFAQDKATEKALDYSHIGDGIQLIVRDYRDQRLHDADEAVAFMLFSAKSLTIAVLICAFVAFFLIGPIGLASMHRGVLSRLGEVTGAMARLARHDTKAAVPYRTDRDEIGEMARAVEIFKDNAIQLISRENELKQLNSRIDIALNNMTHGLCMFDADEKLIVCNATYIQMYGLTGDEARPGTPLARIDSHRAKIGTAAIASPEQAAAVAQSGREFSAFTQELMDGRIIALSQRPMADGGWVAVHEDITERRRAEAKISHLARHDLLTNLPNRVLFRELEQPRNPARRRMRSIASTDHFKTVNDTLGHPIGDELLRLPARCRRCRHRHGGAHRRRVRDRADRGRAPRAVQRARLADRRPARPALPGAGPPRRDRHQRRHRDRAQ